MDFMEHTLSYLTFFNIILSIATYFAATFIYQIVYYHFFHPLSIFPGPFWAGVTRLWIAWHNVRTTELTTTYELIKKYGPVVRITPTLLLVSDSTKLPQIYHRTANKTDHYVTGCFGETEILINMQQHKVHAAFRKLLAAPYSFSNVKKMEPLVDVRVENWIDRIDEKFAKTGEAFDFTWWATFMTYDIISEIGFGAPFGFVEQGKDIGGLIHGFHHGLPLFGLISRLYPFTNWIKSTPLKRFVVSSPQDKSGLGILMRFRDKLLAERMNDIKQGKDIGRVDLLQIFLEAKGDDGKPLDLEYVRAEILLVLLAGADTTGTAFQGMICNIMTKPGVYNKMMAEIDNATKNGLLSSMPKYDEVVEHLPYYVACIRETMRLYPSAPNMFPRYVSKPGMDLYGKFAPPGTEIACNPWVSHRDTNIYGEDAEEFRPERWLDPERAKLFNKYNLAFGYGTRICLGRDLAMMELYKAPLQFFRTFKLILVNETQPAKYVARGGVAIWSDLWLKISRRPQVKVSVADTANYGVLGDNV